MGGQRTFLGDVGIFVLGVLVALIIGEVPNASRQRVEATRTMVAVRAGMFDNSTSFEVTSRLVKCANRRLDAVPQELAQLRRTGRRPAIGEDGSQGWSDFLCQGWSDFRSGSYESAVANPDTL
jgi:hypothetical protein